MELKDCNHATDGQGLKKQCLAAKGEDIKIISFSKHGNKRMITYQCLRCKKVTTKALDDFLKNHRCYCNNKDNDIQIEREFKTLGAKCLNTHNGMYKPVLFKCEECGFIWKTRPDAVLRGHGCPKCK